ARARARAPDLRSALARPVAHLRRRQAHAGAKAPKRLGGPVRRRSRPVSGLPRAARADSAGRRDLPFLRVLTVLALAAQRGSCKASPLGVLGSRNIDILLRPCVLDWLAFRSRSALQICSSCGLRLCPPAAFCTLCSAHFSGARPRL